MAKAKFVKLGEKANSFYDPSTGFKLSKNQVGELTTEMQVSRKIKNALKNGHIEIAEEGEFEDVNEIEVNEDKDQQFTESELMSKSKEGLINLLIRIEESLPEDERSTSAELNKMNKTELTEAIMESYEDDEEDED